MGRQGYRKAPKNRQELEKCTGTAPKRIVGIVPSCALRYYMYCRVVRAAGELNHWLT